MWDLHAIVINKDIPFKEAQQIAKDIIKNKNDVNRKYYPYFIYKIIEYYFRDNKDKLILLNFIHLQKKKH